MDLIYHREKTLFNILAILASLAWLIMLISTLGIVLIYVAMGYVFYLFAQSGLISYLKGNSVIISQTQFPDLHDRIMQCAQKLDMPPPDQAFLLHGGGIFNAFATKFLGRNYIALYSDVVDALEDQPDAINFYIGHELGHIKRKHIAKGTFLLPVKWLPLLGAAYARSCETTCDRHGLECCSNPNDARLGMAALAAGGKRWKKLEQSEYARQARTQSGFWMSFHELCSDYPWLSKRMSALLQLSEKQEPRMAGRHPFAYLLACFVPRTGIPGGGGLLVMVMIIGILAAVAIPAYQQYVARAKMAQAIQMQQNAYSTSSPDELSNQNYANQNSATQSQ